MLSDQAKKEQVYSDKEIAVFEAVAQLLNQGRKPYDLKVAEIAAAANIGKGTAYEYFSSKTELLRKAIHYHIISEYEQIRALANRSGRFQQTFCDLLDYAEEMMNSRMPNLWAMLSTLDPDEVKAMAADEHLSMVSLMTRLDDLIEQIMQRGIAEGLICAGTSRSYRHFVLTGAVSAYINAIRQLECLGLQPGIAVDADLSNAPDPNLRKIWLIKSEELKADAWNMLLKSLN